MSETRFSATTIHGRLLRLAVLTAAVLSLMVVMSPPALAASDNRCSQRGGHGDNTVTCFVDNGRRYVTFDVKISRLLTDNETHIIFSFLIDNVEQVLNNHSGCTCDVALPLPGSCTKAIEDVVRNTLLSFNISILAIKVVLGPCKMPEACLSQGQ